MTQAPKGDGERVAEVDDARGTACADDVVAPPDPRRRSVLAAAVLGVGGATFFGPWKTNHVWAQAAQKKPLVIGLTMDASGQYAASGGEERLGAMMAIKEFNDKGGVLGRRIEALHMDT